MEATAPPALLALVAHPLRWRLLQELTRSDRAVRELTDRVSETQNLVSYHLKQLRKGGLVRARRSAADGRDTYYAVDLESCEEQLRSVATALHPGLALVPEGRTPATPKRRVLFLCTGNSARSQMAAALIEQLSAGAVDAASAGSHPKPLHVGAVAVMRARGIDIGANRPTHVDELAGERFDVVITLCDKVREVCPELPGHPDLVHWSMADPSQAALDGDPLAFERTAVELENRIRFLLPLLDEARTS